MEFQTLKEKEFKLEKEISEEIVSNETKKEITQLEVNRSEMVDLREKMTRYEKLTLDKIELELQEKIERNVVFGSKSRDRGFDGFSQIRNRFLLFEVKYIRREFFPISLLETILYKAASVKQEISKNDKYSDYKFKLVIVVVSELQEEQLVKLKNHVSKYLVSELIETEIKYYKTSELDEN